MTERSSGALPRTAVTALAAAEEAGRLADRAGRASAAVDDAASALATGLGGGPPGDVVTSIDRARAASGDLAAARAALTEAAAALRAFAGRSV